MESEFITGFTPVKLEGDYYGLKDFISYSGLKNLKTSPAHYKQYKDEPAEVETDAMAFGSAYHTYILEPERFEAEYYVFDDDAIYQVLIGEGFKSPRSTKQYKEWQESEMRVIGDRKVIEKDNYKKIVDMKEKLMQHYYCRALLSKGEAEKSITGILHTTEGDINLKGRPDYIRPDKHFIIDLKTTFDASVDGFTRAAADGGYHIQAALYSDLMEMITNDGRGWSFYFIAQEKRKPYAFNIFEASAQFIGQGRYEYEQLLKLYNMCLKEGRWPGYQVFCQWKSGNIELNLPPWAVKKIEFYNHKI
jgi:exodeoxyribonuclease VIII